MHFIGGGLISLKGKTFFLPNLVAVLAVVVVVIMINVLVVVVVVVVVVAVVVIGLSKTRYLCGRS